MGAIIGSSRRTLDFAAGSSNPSPARANRGLWQTLQHLNGLATVDEDAQIQLQDTQKLYDKVFSDFRKAGLQDRKALIARIQLPLQQRQTQLDRYLTEALLGLQRLGQTANKDR